MADNNMNETTGLSRRGSKNGIKRKKSPSEASPFEDNELCSFCHMKPAAVRAKVQGGFKRPLCLVHYYSSSASQSTDFEPLPEEWDKQLPAMQSLFAEAFVQLQQEIAEEAARSYAATNNIYDPLAILHHLDKRRKVPPPKPKTKANKTSSRPDGGFLREVPLPERLLRTQQEQAALHVALTERMNRVSKEGSANVPAKRDLSQRRKSSRRSIWNSVLDDRDEQGQAKGKATSKSDSAEAVVQSNAQESDNTCSCGSSHVVILSTNSNRNQDSHKGETWGFKDRADDVIIRYQCQECGKTWNEEE